MTLAISYLTTPAAGEIVSGDAVVVRRDADTTLLAVVDVLGHGPEAAKVAARAVEHLEVTPLADASTVMTSLHAALRGTRGAAASLYLVERDRIQGCGVGNVELRVIGTALNILLTPGILGQQVRTLRTFEGRVAPGDRLVCFSDGISSRMPMDDLRGLSPRDACGVAMKRHRRSHDDATVLIADVETHR